MKQATARTCAGVLSCAALLAGFAMAMAQPAPPGLRFAAYELWIETGDRELAAWQVEVTDPAAHAQLVGLEGGSEAAYADAPYYDRAALLQHRVIVAAFSLEATLPSGRTHVATLHFALDAASDSAFEVVPVAAADPSGASITIDAVLVEKEQK
ncbi:MAG: hypothetical protein ACKVX7_05025 [Planctomycetota bacterium]